jgi:hypothetical protein
MDNSSSTKGCKSLRSQLPFLAAFLIEVTGQVSSIKNKRQLNPLAFPFIEESLISLS